MTNAGNENINGNPSVATISSLEETRFRKRCGPAEPSTAYTFSRGNRTGSLAALIAKAKEQGVAIRRPTPESWISCAATPTIKG